MFAYTQKHTPSSLFFKNSKISLKSSKKFWKAAKQAAATAHWISHYVPRYAIQQTLFFNRLN